MDGRPFVRHEDEVEAIGCPCGQSRRIVTAGESTQIGLHVTDMGAARRHYHLRTAEIYYVLSGAGSVLAGDETHPVSPGSTVYIPPGVPHCAVGSFRAVVAMSPPFDAEDEHLCD